MRSGMYNFLSSKCHPVVHENGPCCKLCWKFQWKMKYKSGKRRNMLWFVLACPLIIDYLLFLFLPLFLPTVQVPGCDGKAGMAAIVDPDGTLDVARLYTDLQQCLPSYALPVFVRLVSACELTGTFKLKKVALARAGFRLEDVGTDPVYIAVASQRSYVQLQVDETYSQLLTGKLRV